FFPSQNKERVQLKQTSQPREDLRQRRTRKLLADALLSLLEERPLSEISVVDICQRAMVHRTTFYAHFDDKLALLRYAVDELQKYFEPVDPSLDPRTGPREYFMVLFHNALSFLKSHRGMFLTVQGAAEFYVLDEIITDALKRKLSESAPAAGFDPELTARFYAGGLLALIRWWLSSGADVPDEVLLRHVEHFIPQPELPV
ncbi:TetR/AcrR family transcriptional regulator, partial [Flavonifractor plautii]|uniref:TetR/AcrR family transcriptional regulator n=1 Tax=Flavonifractor plautii TaxID=292800 RepID=UPI00325A89AE